MSSTSFSSPITIESYDHQATTHRNAASPTTPLTQVVVGPSTSTTPTQGLPNTKKRTAEELEVTHRTKKRFSFRLASDHAAVLSPDVDTPFASSGDLVDRLLPYHVFQHPKEDMERISLKKGKEKAQFQRELRKEIADTKFALECSKRMGTLGRRFCNVMIRSGKRKVFDDQAYVLAQAILDADRAENAVVHNELRSARAELERWEKEKRTNAMARPVYYTALGQQATSQSPYYRGYQYGYTQVYSTPVQPTPASTSTGPLLTQSPSHGAIPVQLPVASLPALHGLGIIPVPVTSLSSDTQPQPAAVLRGSSANGTMLSLEINVSLLQSSQMSGLALILNSLMSRTNTTTTSEIPQSLPVLTQKKDAENSCM